MCPIIVKLLHLLQFSDVQTKIAQHLVTHDDNYTTWIRHSKVKKKRKKLNKIPCPGPVIVPWHLHSHSRAIAATPIDWHFQTGCLRLRSVSVWFENFRRCNNGFYANGPGTWTAYPDVAQAVCSSMPPFCRHVSWNRSCCRRQKKKHTQLFRNRNKFRWFGLRSVVKSLAHASAQKPLERHLIIINEKYWPNCKVRT